MKRILALVLAFVVAFYSIPAWTIKADTEEMQTEETQNEELKEEKKVIVEGGQYGNVQVIEYITENKENGKETTIDCDGVKIDDELFYEFKATANANGFFKEAVGINLSDDNEDGIYESELLSGKNIPNYAKIVFDTTDANITITNNYKEYGKVKVINSDKSEIKPQVEGNVSIYKTNIFEQYTIIVSPEKDCEVIDLPMEFTKIENSNDYEYVTKNGEYNCTVNFVHKKVNVNISYKGKGAVYTEDQTTQIYNNENVQVEYKSNLSLVLKPSVGNCLFSINGKEVYKCDFIKCIDNTNDYELTLEGICEDTILTIEFIENQKKDVKTLNEGGFDIYANSGTVIEDNTNENYCLYILPKGAEGGIREKNGKKININNKPEFNQYKFDKNVKLKTSTIINTITIKDNLNTDVQFNPQIVVLSDNCAPSMSFEGDWDKDSVWIADFTKEYTFKGNIWDNGPENFSKEYKAGISKLVVSTSKIEDPTKEENYIEILKDGKFEYKLDKVPTKNTTYYFYPIDRAGNFSEYTKTIKVDNSMPNIKSVLVNTDDYSINPADNVAYTNRTSTSVEVSVTDDNGSGVKSVSLYKDGVLFQTQEAIEGVNKYVFSNVPIDKDASNSFAAVASDKVGHEIKYEDRKNATLNAIVYDINDPEINLNLNGIHKNEIDKNVVYYINEKQQTKYDLNIKLESLQNNLVSGIDNVSVRINGKELSKDADGKSFSLDKKKKHTELNYKILLSGADEYIVDISVKTISGQEANKSYIIKKDSSKPVWVEGSNQFEGGIAEFGLDFTDRNVQDYGFFGSSYMRYVFQMVDMESGMKNVTYYYTDAEGKVSSTKDIIPMHGNIGEQVTGEIVFPEDSKGFIHIIGADNVDNPSKEYMTAGFVTESKEKHAKESSIIFNSQSASVKDEAGNNLYDRETNLSVIVSDDWSGIKQIEWSVEVPNDSSANTYGNVEVASNMELYGNTNGVEWSKTKSSHNLVTQMSAVIPINANSNDILVNVTLTDRVGNRSTESYSLSIDKTAPKVSISFDNNNARMNNIYKEDRVATIAITERNFDSNAVEMMIKAVAGKNVTISDWSEIIDESNPDNNTYIATVRFSEDDDYQFNVKCKDLAGNNSEEVTVEPFSIDKTAPIIKVELDGSLRNGNYCSTNRTATITVNEHYFDENSITISSNATNEGNQIAFPTISGWTTNGDFHTTTITFSEDGLYSFSIGGTDMAGNTASDCSIQEFYIDKTMPEVLISGVDNYSANKGVVAPNISFTDLNYDINEVSVKLSGANLGIVDAIGKYSNIEKGQTFIFDNFKEDKDTDDIYTLVAMATDKAGNCSQQTITFSVNRFGSVYVFDNELRNNVGKYINHTFDVSFTETNADILDMETIKLTVSANGAPRDLELGKDYKVEKSGGNGSWSQYKYIIDKSVFEGDGTYIITALSVDKAGNINQNIDESKAAEIGFGIDTTPPVIVPINIEKDTYYDAKQYEAKVSVVDNLVLSDVNVTVNKDKTDVTNKGETYLFSIKENNASQNIKITAIDAAGNKVICRLPKVVVSTDVVTEMVNNPSMLYATVGGVIIAGGAILGIIVTRKKGIVKVKVNKR